MWIQIETPRLARFIAWWFIVGFSILMWVVLALYTCAEASPQVAVDPPTTGPDVVYWTCEGGWFSPSLTMEAVLAATPCKLMDGTAKILPKGGLLFDAALAPDNTTYSIRCKAYNASGGSGPLSDPFEFRKEPSGKPPSTALCR